MNGGGLNIGFFKPEDGQGVVNLFTEEYGNNYPITGVYNPDRLQKGLEDRDYIPIVVRTPDHGVVGYAALTQTAPDMGVYEKVSIVISKDYRNRGVLGMMFRYVKETLPTIREIHMLCMEAICNYTYSQRAALSSLPFVETALAVDTMPAEAYGKDRSVSGRISTLYMFMTVVTRPHVIYIPEPYREYLEFIYNGFDHKRHFSVSREGFPPSRQTVINSVIYDFAKVARVTVREAGQDFESVFASEELSFLGRDVKVIQVWLKLSWPWIGRAVAVLREKGYFLGGMLNQWFGEDGLLMQKVLLQPNWEGINLFSERAGTILDYVKTDWQR